jgi:two-component system cell cycle sensor histidine kinase/response regulator CckA
MRAQEFPEANRGSYESMNPGPDIINRAARVLIVDDERRNRELMEVMLTPEGFELSTAASGEEALAIVEEQPPDLILLDIMMPGMDGYQVVRAIRSRPSTRNVPVIMVTALDDRQAKMLGLSAGAEEFLTRPLDRAELCVRVKNLLRLKAYGDYYGDYSAMLEREVAARTADLVARTKTLEDQSTALRLSEERTNYALGAAGMGVLELDPLTERLTWSETMPAVFGLDWEHMPTDYQGFLTLLHRDDRQAVQDSLLRAARTRTAFEGEFRTIWPDGHTHWIAGRARLVEAADGRPMHLLGIVTDISDRKSLEVQLRQSQKMETVGQLAGGVAHDFNNLLTAILGYAGFVIETLGPKDPRLTDMEQVVKAGQRAAQLTKQLMTFSRKQVLQPTVIDLNALVTGMRHMLSRLIGEHLELVSILAPELGAVWADHGQLEQVLMNLVLNAKDAMSEGGRLTVETTNVEHDGSLWADVAIQPGRYVMLAVSDSGTGMDAETKQRLFEPFFTTKAPGKGTGLGLATVYGIVKQSGGYISVYSEPNMGTSFKVFLPRTEEAAASPIAAEPPLAPGTEMVLVVEDEDPVRLLLRTMLERGGYRVLDAPNPERAVELFENPANVFDLLVTDVIMPGSTGSQLFERLVQRRPELKVLYVSGYTDDAIVHQGQLKPGVDFLQKPFTTDALHRRVRAVLDR